MIFLTEPRFKSVENPLYLHEVRDLLNVSNCVAVDLVVSSIVCAKNTQLNIEIDKTLIFSDLDVLVAHLFLAVSNREVPRHARLLLAIAAVSDFEAALSTSDGQLPFVEDVRIILREFGTLRSLFFDKYEERMANEICSFWPKIRLLSRVVNRPAAIRCH